eukprot:7217142-Pyramimonas_sp.AAC.1
MGGARLFPRAPRPRRRSDRKALLAGAPRTLGCWLSLIVGVILLGPIASRVARYSPRGWIWSTTPWGASSGSQM